MTFNTLYRDPDTARQILADDTRRSEIDNPTKLSIALSRMLRDQPPAGRINTPDRPGDSIGEVQTKTTPDASS